MADNIHEIPSSMENFISGTFELQLCNGDPLAETNVKATLAASSRSGPLLPMLSVKRNLNSSSTRYVQYHIHY